MKKGIIITIVVVIAIGTGLFIVNSGKDDKNLALHQIVQSSQKQQIPLQRRTQIQ